MGPSISLILSLIYLNLQLMNLNDAKWACIQGSSLMPTASSSNNVRLEVIRLYYFNNNKGHQWILFLPVLFISAAGQNFASCWWVQLPKYHFGFLIEPILH